MTLLLLTAVRSASADLNAAWEGTITSKGSNLADVAAALNQSGAQVIGTVALGQDPVFNVTGSAHGKRVKFRGLNSGGSTFTWAGTAVGDQLRGKAKVRGSSRMRGTLVLSKSIVEPPAQPPQTCDSSFFTGQVMGVALSRCAGCHVAGGTAANAALRVTLGDPIATQESVDNLIDKQDPDNSRLLKKPLNLLPHGGGQQLVAGSNEDQILHQWINLVATGQQCSASGDSPMMPMSASELLVRASMDVRGKRPALAELDQIEGNTGAYESLVDQYLQSDEFLDRVKDVYDDALLVRREDFTDEARDETSAIYGEALELIGYIVKNDRPLTEMGTATYTVANDLFQRDVNRMPYMMEPATGSAWQPVHYLDGRPHAGVLSTSAFYQVWDTNNTNKNRRRANRTSILFHCYNFLDTPVDVTRNVDNNDANAVLNAVTTRSDCKACHDRLDPLASFFFPMDNAMIETSDGTNFLTGNPERWRSANKRPPAVYGKPGADIRDMGRLLVEHEKFAQCQTKRAFKILFTRDPKSNAELTLAADMATKWGPEDGYNFRKLVKRWMLSDVYTQRPKDDNPDWVRRTSPERLEIAVKDLTGFVWQRDPSTDEDHSDPNADPFRTDPIPLLTTEENGYKIIFGGINGVNVSARSVSLNASVQVVQRKLAALAADDVVTKDLGKPNDQRKLLTGVSGTETPTTDEVAIRIHLADMARRLYGEHYATDSAAVNAWFTLYTQLYNDVSQGGTGSGKVPGTRTERAWRGVLVAMLRSPRIVLY